MNDVQALYTFETQWLLLTEASWLKDLQENSVGDIDNVASVVPMRATDKSSESLVEVRPVLNHGIKKKTTSNLLNIETEMQRIITFMQPTLMFS